MDKIAGTAKLPVVVIVHSVYIHTNQPTTPHQMFATGSIRERTQHGTRSAMIVHRKTTSSSTKAGAVIAECQRRIGWLCSVPGVALLETSDNQYRRRDGFGCHDVSCHIMSDDAMLYHHRKSCCWSVTLGHQTGMVMGYLPFTPFVSKIEKGIPRSDDGRLGFLYLLGAVISQSSSSSSRSSSSSSRCSSSAIGVLVVGSTGGFTAIVLRFVGDGR
jgi:hypothetical protein